MQNRTIGFVPTMGALHLGHISLIEASVKACDITVCSIFVNPTQFNQPSDFELYPRLPEQDVEMLLKAGCNVLFMPEAFEMYPRGLEIKQYNYGLLTHSLEGAFRPGHFDGVITIVKRLFDIVKPHQVFFGQKDLQQCMVVKRLIRIEQLPIQMHIIPTVREADGLAMSSRNLRLSTEERNDALMLYKALKHIYDHLGQKPLEQLIYEATDLANTTLKTEYIAVVNSDTFEPVAEGDVLNHAAILGAAWCGNVRIIDNLIIS